MTDSKRLKNGKKITARFPGGLQMPQTSWFPWTVLDSVQIHVCKQFYHEICGILQGIANIPQSALCICNISKTSPLHFLSIRKTTVSWHYLRDSTQNVSLLHELLLVDRNTHNLMFFSDRASFIHSVFCLTTGSKPPPKRFLHIVRSRASSFK